MVSPPVHPGDGKQLPRPILQVKNNFSEKFIFPIDSPPGPP
jgi:hypothetical protein